MDLPCPRCSGPLEAAFYGPCPTCRTALREAAQRDGRTVARAAFEPVMHVTPNAVALKE